MIYQGFKSQENPLNLNKGYLLWTLRQLCASRETLPKSCILPIEFKTSDPHHAAGGFADVWKGTYEGGDVAYKTLRRSTQVDDATRLKRKVGYEIFSPQGTSVTFLYCFRGGSVRK